ncbi:GntR family transcriptional regulator [Thalassotalea sp. HSM 43]|uniref:GntR family transcriptional regulator n=1 Tax=Thalassotalea sp. HSM 43 TaxID=2552945 RepID=UPI0010807C0C|nr:GntR family transcriptional regulator [Thalassotalea sp. HSM 43]QBY04546.1 GntR family transcriptional regulator [Thalassotalea sp. HSM 43]
MTFEELLSDPRLGQALKSDVPTPLYHQVYLFLKEKIHLGEIPFGEKMPTEHQLSEAFSVSRITAKRAMDELAEEGYISRRRGKGSHVIYKHRAEQLKAPLSGLLENLKTLGQETEVRSITFQKAVPPLDIQERFGIGPDEELIQSVRVRMSDGQPFGYYVSWTRDIGELYSEQSLYNSSRMEIFRKAGIQLDKVQQSVTATLSNMDTALVLEIPTGRPLLLLDRSMYDADGKLFDHLYAIYRPDKYQFDMEFSMK